MRAGDYGVTAGVLPFVGNVRSHLSSSSSVSRVRFRSRMAVISFRRIASKMRDRLTPTASAASSGDTASLGTGPVRSLNFSRAAASLNIYCSPGSTPAYRGGRLSFCWSGGLQVRITLVLILFCQIMRRNRKNSIHNTSGDRLYKVSARVTGIPCSSDSRRISSSLGDIQEGAM
jgi:hypothetical protein